MIESGRTEISREISAYDIVEKWCLTRNARVFPLDCLCRFLSASTLTYVAGSWLADRIYDFRVVDFVVRPKSKFVEKGIWKNEAVPYSKLMLSGLVMKASGLHTVYGCNPVYYILELLIPLAI